ncbi:DUF443 family protein [uncultured Streptococcus sp.]|uniref:DUF443 family protein n=1 Tax=uncultured Streptococcus sp. TaxID=83427 RepID=UPI00267739B6|nr:DUF443 family protein [uncultured Streptococcus sp.]MBS5753363.1 DUF443 family protein [Streptococcus parasanguinis]
MVNVKINFRGLDVAYFDVLEMGQKKYVLDSNSTRPKSYYWGLSPENLEVDLIELDSQNKNFDKRINMGPSGMSMVGGFLGLLLYRVATSIFRYYDISHNLYLKVSLFLISILVAYIVYQSILMKSRKEISSRLSQEKKRFKIVFQNNKKKRQFHAYLFILLHAIALAIYMGEDDGTEAAILVLNGMLAYVFIWIESGAIPLIYDYNKKYLEFKELKEV